MKERTVKSSVDEVAARLHNGVDAAQEKIDDNIDATAERFATLEKQLRQAGDLLLDNAKTLSAEATKQVRLHPLAAFGVAFVAGITVAKLLRR